MPRTKGSKNKPKTVTADFATQIAEKQSAKEALTAEIASITANIDTLKADLKEKKTALKKAEKEVAMLEAKKAKADAKAAEAAKKAEAEAVLKKLLASGMTADEINAVVDEIPNVQVANYNCPGQIVISGLKEAVEIAAVKLKEAGARRVIPLNVSGPFHSYLLEEAGEKLGKFLENIPVSEPKIPYVANVTAAYVTKAEDVKPLLTRQVSSSVRWQQSVETMLADGVDRFIEIGPGKTLAGFIRKINREATVINLSLIHI